MQRVFQKLSCFRTGVFIVNSHFLNLDGKIKIISAVSLMKLTVKDALAFLMLSLPLELLETYKWLA